MREPRALPRAPPPNRIDGAAARCVLALLALGVGAPAAASNLGAQAQLGAGYDDQADSSQEYIRQVYQLQFAQRVSDPISYRLLMLYQDDRGTLTMGGERDRQRSREFAPSAFLSWRPDGLSLVLSTALSSGATFDRVTARMISRKIERHAATLRLRLMDNADLLASASRLAFSGADVDTDRIGAGVGADWVLGPLRLSNFNRAERYTDSKVGSDLYGAHSELARVSLGPQLTAEYAQVGTRWSLGARYTFSYTRTEQQALATTTLTVPSDVQPLAGLYAIGDFPPETAPMPTEARLVDGAVDASAGINIGPGGVSFHNVGIDMGRNVTLDELRIHVRSGTGQPVPFGGAVSWTVWSSQDGMRWVQVDGQAEAFSTAMSAYVVGFSSTSARFFKAVNFGVNTVETFVTEVQPFVREYFVAGETLVAHSIAQGVALNASAAVTPKVSLSYMGRVNGSSSSGFRGRSRAAGDTTNMGNVRLGPFGDFTFDVGATQLDTWADAGVGQSRIGLTQSTAYRPIERFETKLDLRYVLDSVGSVHTTTTGAALSSSAGIYDSLRASASLGVSRQNVGVAGSTDYMTASGALFAQVRRDIDARLDASVQRSVAETGNPAAVLASVPVLQVVLYHRYFGELRYRPSTQVDLLGRVGYTSTPRGSGIVRKARGYWTPFPGGNVRLGFDYDVEVDSLTGRSYRQMSAHPQWLINTHANLSLRYNDVRGSGGADIRQQSVNLSLSIVL